MSDTDLKEDFGLEPGMEQLLVRKALKRFLDLDRWENAVRGRKFPDIRDDPVLRELMLPIAELEIGKEIAQGGFGVVSRGVFTPRASRGRVEANRRYPVAIKDMKGERNMRLQELLKECRI